MVTSRASGSADQADGTMQKKTKINRERTRVIWTSTQVDGAVRTSGRSEVNESLGENRVAVNGPYVSGFFDHDAAGDRPGVSLSRMFVVRFATLPYHLPLCSAPYSFAIHACYQCLVRHGIGVSWIARACACRNRSLFDNRMPPMRIPELGQPPCRTRQNGRAKSNGMTWIRITPLDSTGLRPF